MGWDIGYASPPLTNYCDQIDDKSIRILIPGAGNAYEAKYLFERGFSNVFILDISAQPLDKFKKENPQFPSDQLIEGDFFEHEGQYDLILEQTFFCALDPSLRSKYVHKMQELLKKDGKLAGVLFNAPMFSDHPPFGGSIKEYRPLFEKKFRVKVLEPCYNSIEPRQGSEAFFILQKG